MPVPRYDTIVVGFITRCSTRTLMYGKNGLGVVFYFYVVCRN